MNGARLMYEALVVGMLLGASCGGLAGNGGAVAPDAAAASDAGTRAAGGYFDPSLAVGEAAPLPSQQGLQYSGAVAVRSSRLAATVTRPISSADAADTSAEAWVELSAPILPKVGVLYTGEGGDYPATPQAQALLAHDSALTFETLLVTCQPLYPGIVLWHPGDAPLSDAQVLANYQLLEDCAYQQYLAKPYWIPQLVVDVEICRQELGPGWRMLTEDDVLVLAKADAQAVQATLDGVQTSGPGAHPGSFLFSLSVWVLGNDGSIGAANLQPGSDPSFTPLSATVGMFFNPRIHYEGGLTLRCLRVTGAAN